MASNYPPGVTGSEYPIAGPDYEKESDTPCPCILWYGVECGAPTMEYGYDYERWLVCDNEHTTELEPSETKCEKCDGTGARHVAGEPTQEPCGECSGEGVVP